MSEATDAEGPRLWESGAGVPKGYANGQRIERLERDIVGHMLQVARLRACRAMVQDDGCISYLCPSDAEQHIAHFTREAQHVADTLLIVLSVVTAGDMKR